MIKICVTDTDGKIHEIEGNEGDSLMQAAVDAGLDIRAECGGALACATCHMYIDKDWLTTLDAQHEDEKDMLDFADQVASNSRLSCQIELKSTLHGLKATIAPGF